MFPPPMPPFRLGSRLPVLPLLLGSSSSLSPRRPGARPPFNSPNDVGHVDPSDSLAHFPPLSPLHLHDNLSATHGVHLSARYEPHLRYLQEPLLSLVLGQLYDQGILQHAHREPAQAAERGAEDAALHSQEKGHRRQALAQRAEESSGDDAAAQGVEVRFCVVLVAVDGRGELLANERTRERRNGGRPGECWSERAAFEFKCPTVVK